MAFTYKPYQTNSYYDPQGNQIAMMLGGGGINMNTGQMYQQPYSESTGENGEILRYGSPMGATRPEVARGGPTVQMMTYGQDHDRSLGGILKEFAPMLPMLLPGMPWFQALGTLGKAGVQAALSGLGAAAGGGDILRGALTGGLSAGLGPLMSKIPGFASLPGPLQSALKGGILSGVSGGDPVKGAFVGGLGGLGGMAFDEVGLPKDLGSMLAKGAYGVYSAGRARDEYSKRAQLLASMRNRRGPFPQQSFA